MKNIFKITFVLFALLASSCASKVQMEDLTSKQIILEGQTAFESKNYKMALRYYNYAIERFGEYEPNTYVEAKYEIGHIYMKQKKYKLAKNIFDEISELYSMTLPGQLPGAYLKLAQIELEKISDSEKEE